ncbi:MAG: GWxTD domain-containing protein [Bacteroidetes bacterium]|nr:GWxTD domain-containing protein [Bacteroidota bacterium]
MIFNFQKKYLILFFVFQFGFAQEYYNKGETDSPKFEKRLLGFFIPDSNYGKLDIYLNLFTNTLHFEKQSEKYFAQVEINILIKKEDKTVFLEKSWNENFIVNSYNETFKLNLGKLLQRSFHLPLENYFIKISIKYFSTKKITSEEIFFNDLNKSKYKELKFSSVLMLKNFSNLKTGSSLIPNLTNIIEEGRDTLKIFYELYNYKKLLNDSINLKYLFVTPVSDTFIIKNKMIEAKKSNQIIEELYVKKIMLGNSKLLIIATPTSDKNNFSSTTLEVNSRIGNELIEIKDLDIAIQQTKYIAKEKEFKELTEAKSIEDKKELFNKFWKKRDETPDSDMNEYFAEYYKRVEYSNKRFSHFIDGWKTDMGMVFIILGPPNNIERHPFELNTKPYEVWQYYIYNRQLIFTDDSGFGDYRLTTPIWDLIHRIIK